MAVVITRWSVLFAGLLLAAYFDVKTRKIPNWLTVSLAVLGLLLAAIAGKAALRSSAIGFAFALALGVMLWLLGAVRAGDAKLMAAIGATQGTLWFLDCMTWALLAGMAMGIAVLLKKGELAARMRRLFTYFRNIFLAFRFRPYVPKEGTERELPFALPILLGAILAVFIPVWRV